MEKIEFQYGKRNKLFFYILIKTLFVYAFFAHFLLKLFLILKLNKRYISKKKFNGLEFCYRQKEDVR